MPRQITDGLASAFTSKVCHKSKASSILLQLSCSLCAALSILCCFLITFIVLISNQITSANAFVDLYGKSSFRHMGKDSTQNELAFRLPPEVKPRHYELTLHPDLTTETFKGKVTITIDVSGNRKNIALHQKDLKITSTKLNIIDNEEDMEMDIEDAYNVDELEMYMVTTKNELVPGRYNLTLEFNGNLKDKIVGFYSSKYKNEKNETRKIATTKFEPTYARQSFPCFDEPNFKAEFTIHLVHPTGDCYNALSNMNIENVAVNKPSAGLTTATFAKSVPMATYVTCFIISDFVANTASATSLDGKKLPVSVYTTREQKEKGKFALDVGVKVIEFYSKLFKNPYPLPKLDMAAIPDFVSGAMENWGMVTYREQRLLYEEGKGSTSQKESVVLVIAHEFAHMWFGNLVTMKWWNDLWLNEGFATFMSFKCANEIFPDWNIMNQFLTDETHVAYITDAKVSSHPIVQTVSNPDEITAIFDVITYKKGAAVIRMLEHFVGPDVFYAGISKYLSKFAYHNAETADLFSILQESVKNKINITAIMDTWTRQMGFPMVNVTRNKNTFTLTQKRFLTNPDAEYDVNESEYRYKWTIPITYITNTNSNPTLIWFDMNADKLTIKCDEHTEWIKINCDQVGYYHVNYEPAEWQAINDVLRFNHKRLSSADRAHIIDDAFSLAEASQLNYSIAMDLTTYLTKEQDNVAWHVAQSKFVQIDKLLRSTKIISKFRNYVRNIVDSTYHDVTWDVSNMDDITTLNLRSVILGLACSVGHIECLDDAGKVFKDWIHDPKDARPHPDIRSLVYYYGMSHVGGDEEWNLMFQKFINETNAQEKIELMYGLTGRQDSSTLEKFILIAMDENYVRSQDTLTCLTLIAANPIGTPLVWDWVRDNWEILVKRYTLNDRYLGLLIPGITKTFATRTKLDEMKAFFKKYPEAGAGKSYRERALETVSNNIKWLEQNADKLEAWLDAHAKLTKPL